jgi:hypothetical protein
MAFTRFSSDDARQQKRLEESVYTGIYHLNTPGNQLSFIEDPHIRLQKWGGNLRTNTCNLEGDLMGTNKQLSRHTLPNKKVHTKETYHSSSTFNISETLQTHPSWHYRESKQHRNNILLENPQKHIFEPFEVDARRYEKDSFTKNKK